MEKNELLKIIKKYEYVSFDLFDTLIFRTVDTPEDVWVLVENEYNRVYSKKLNFYKQIRMFSERRARKHNGNTETKLDDIFYYMPYNEKVKNRLKELEKRIEVSISLCNKDMFEVLEECYKLRKKIIITTDMYLPKETIMAILNKHNIFFDHLFISCEIGVTKLSGLLFPKILNILNISPKEIIHIGDNPISDIKMPAKCGIVGINRIMRDKHTLIHTAFGKTTVKKTHLENFIRLKLNEKDNITTGYEIGYSILGPLIFELCRTINDYKEREKIDIVEFVAREGFFWKKIYDYMYKDSGYIRINKNLLRYPILYIDPSEKKFLDTIPSKHIYSFEEIYKYFPLNNYDNIPSGYMKKKDIMRGKYSSEFKSIFTKNKDSFRNQFIKLLKYLEANQMINKRVLLVNNSINGNGQIMLNELCSKASINIDLFGFQITKSQKCTEKLKKEVYAFLPDGKFPKFYSAMFDYCTILFEYLLFEPIGTALYFKNEGIDICCDSYMEEKNNNLIIEEIQNAAFDFVMDYKSCFIPLDETVLYLFFDFYMNPTYNEASLMNRILIKELDSVQSLVDSINWNQAKKALLNEEMKSYNRKLILKCKIKYILQRLKLI